MPGVARRSIYMSFLVAVLSVAAAGQSMFGRVGLANASQGPVSAENQDAPDGEAPPGIETGKGKGLFKLSLDELMAVEVISVSGVKENMFKSPAAVTVITAEDIRRSGHRSLAEVLRMVPGMNVAQLGSHTWAVSTRGFGEIYSNKLLVLVDGRTVYSPFFGGVFWDQQNVPLENIERIEVIRGPGATIWGANAVNGVINVITKSARDTQGGQATAGFGTYERAFGSLRYGMEVDERTWLRVNGRYFNRDSLADYRGQDPEDEWDMFQGGFRLDREGDDGYSLTVQGDAYYSGNMGRTGSIPTPLPPFMLSLEEDQRISGGNLLFRFGRDLSEDRGWSLQGYYDRVNRDDPVTLKWEQDTCDLEFRHFFPPIEDHALVWGAGYRRVSDDVHGNTFHDLQPDDDAWDTFSAFVQDTITLKEDRLALMAGSKFEYNDFTGFEFQPSLRLSWTPDEKQTIWGAVSRAVRTPTRWESDVDLILFYIPPPPGTPFKFVGNDDLDSCVLLAYEAGYRTCLADNFTLDLAAFFNDYDELVESRPHPTDPLAVTPENAQTAKSYGVEVAPSWDVTDDWRLMGGYSYLKLNYRGPEEDRRDERDPKHQFNVISRTDLTRDLELNSALYYVDDRPQLNVSSYFRWDLGMTWRPTDKLEVAVWGLNLNDDEHLEFVNPSGNEVSGQVERSVYAYVSYRF